MKKKIFLPLVLFSGLYFFIAGVFLPIAYAQLAGAAHNFPKPPTRISDAEKKGVNSGRYIIKFREPPLSL